MKGKGMWTVLAAIVAATLSASPTSAAWPGGTSLILFDGDGFETECVDVAHNSAEVTLFFAERAVPLVTTANADGARYSLSFVLPNDDFGGIYPARNTYAECTCSRWGTPRYQVTGLPVGEGSCACTVTYRGLQGSIRTEPLLGVSLGDGTRCAKAYEKVVLRPRLRDLWNQDPRPR